MPETLLEVYVNVKQKHFLLSTPKVNITNLHIFPKQFLNPSISVNIKADQQVNVSNDKPFASLRCVKESRQTFLNPFSRKALLYTNSVAILARCRE